NRDLGFSAQDRTENIRRIAEVAKLMADAGLVVLTAFVSPYAADRDAARAVVGEDRFVEIFVDTPLEECERRDPKGLYAKARAGQISDFTGISAPFEAPEAPNIHLLTAQRSVAECVYQILGSLPL
ncbi:MAG: adenylyl-sulfate kinase, partial [Schleiferiaceae bacterium]|nr:adenylyl-sulfate kinase [Schleiferiaceae bacterium]